jgi:hypothetical protein
MTFGSSLWELRVFSEYNAHERVTPRVSHSQPGLH